MNKYLVAGFKKGAKENGIHNFNAYIFNEQVFRKEFAWIDSPNRFSKNFRDGERNRKLTLEDVINEVNAKGAIWCENDDCFYLIRSESSF